MEITVNPELEDFVASHAESKSVEIVEYVNNLIRRDKRSMDAKTTINVGFFDVLDKSEPLYFKSAIFEGSIEKEKEEAWKRYEYVIRFL